MVKMTAEEDKEVLALAEKANDEAAKNLRPEEMYFAELVYNGWAQGSAYLKAFPRSKCNRQSAAVAGNKLTQKPEVIAYTIRLKEGLQKSLTGSPVLAACLERDAKRVILASVIADDTQDIIARLRAIEIDNRMAGHEAPRTTVNVSGDAGKLLDLYTRLSSKGEAKPALPGPIELPAAASTKVTDTPPVQ